VFENARAKIVGLAPVRKFDLDEAEVVVRVHGG
jgi:hypothetical protein